MGRKAKGGLLRGVLIAIVGQLCVLTLAAPDTNAQARAQAQDNVARKRPAAKSDTRPARALLATPLAEPRRALVPFLSAPFPYTGFDPATGKPFLDVRTEDRSGRLSPRTGVIHWADETYSDNRVLLDIPAGFNAGRPGLIVLFLHGNKATLERDVIDRQQVPRQVAAAGLNSVLIAPQLAIDAWDSSAGTFWQRSALRRFLDEAAVALAKLHGNPRSKQAFLTMPVVLIGYSGGYIPLAYLLGRGGGVDRIEGVVLLDGLYGELARYTAWIEKPTAGFFVSAFTRSSADGNAELARILPERQVAIATALPRVLEPGSVTFVATAPAVTHADFVTHAWTDDPIRDALIRIPGFPRQGKP